MLFLELFIVTMILGVSHIRLHRKAARLQREIDEVSSNFLVFAQAMRGALRPLLTLPENDTATAEPRIRLERDSLAATAAMVRATMVITSFQEIDERTKRRAPITRENFEHKGRGREFDVITSYIERCGDDDLRDLWTEPSILDLVAIMRALIERTMLPIDPVPGHHPEVPPATDCDAVSLSHN